MNKITEVQWTEQRSQSARINTKYNRREIVRTLIKVRDITSYILI